MKKTKGNLKRNTKKFYKNYRKLANEFRDVESIVQEKEKLRNDILPWASFYDVPFLNCVYYFLKQVSLDIEIEKCKNSDDPVGAFIDSFDHLGAKAEETDIEDMSVNDYFPLVKVMQGHISSIAQYHVPLTVLLDKARLG